MFDGKLQEIAFSSLRLVEKKRKDGGGVRLVWGEGGG